MQLKAQILGILLAISTAIGCIAYEKLTDKFTLGFIQISKVFELLLVFVIGFIFMEHDLQKDLNVLKSNFVIWVWLIIYLLTGITSVFWYMLTKSNGMMTSSIFEMKYILILALFYFFIGDKKFDYNLLIGLILAVASVYFITKNK